MKILLIRDNFIHEFIIWRDILFNATSTSKTLTVTVSPTDTISLGSFTKLSLNFEMCISPSWWTPISTKAPEFVTGMGRKVKGGWNQFIINRRYTRARRAKLILASWCKSSMRKG